MILSLNVSLPRENIIKERTSLLNNESKRKIHLFLWVGFCFFLIFLFFRKSFKLSVITFPFSLLEWFFLCFYFDRLIFSGYFFFIDVTYTVPPLKPKVQSLPQFRRVSIKTLIILCSVETRLFISTCVVRDSNSTTSTTKNPFFVCTVVLKYLVFLFSSIFVFVHDALQLGFSVFLKLKIKQEKK